jgi:hypothetical protein
MLVGCVLSLFVAGTKSFVNAIAILPLCVGGVGGGGKDVSARARMEEHGQSDSETLVTLIT